MMASATPTELMVVNDVTEEGAKYPGWCEVGKDGQALDQPFLGSTITL